MRSMLLRSLAVSGAMAAGILGAEAQAPEKGKPGGPPPPVVEEFRKLQDQLQRLKEDQGRLMKEIGTLQGRMQKEVREGVKPGKEMPPRFPAWQPEGGPGKGWQNQPAPGGAPPWARGGQRPGMGGWQGPQQGFSGPPPWAGGPQKGPGAGAWNRQGPGFPQGVGRCGSCPDRATCPHRGPGGVCPQGRGPCQQGGPAWKGSPFSGQPGRGGFQQYMDRGPAMRGRMESMRDRFLDRNPEMRERVERFQREMRERADQFRNEMRERGGRQRDEMRGRFDEGPRPGGPAPDIDRRLNELERMIREMRSRIPPPPPRGMERGREGERDRERDEESKEKAKKEKEREKGREEGRRGERGEAPGCGDCPGCSGR
jgi:hypothetical protein